MLRNPLAVRHPLPAAFRSRPRVSTRHLAGGGLTLRSIEGRENPAVETGISSNNTWAGHGPSVLEREWGAKRAQTIYVGRVNSSS